MIKDSLKIIAITAGLLLCIEAVLQAVYFIKINSNSPKESILAYQFNDEYLIELIPGTQKIFIRTEENGGDTISWRVNSDGFRGSELQSDPDKRIMVYGDSNIQARFSVEDSTFVQKIGKYLTKDNTRNLEMINSGVIGFGPDQSLLKFEKEVSIYKPDVVVFTIFAYNDFGDLVRNRLFELDDQGSLIKTNFELEEDAHLKEIKHGFRIQTLFWVEQIRNKIYNELEDQNSSEYKKGLLNYYSEANKRAFEIYKNGGKREFSNFEDPFDIDLVIQLDSESSSVKKELFKKILERFKETAEKNNAELVVVILPSPIEMTVSNDYIGYEYLKEQFPSYNREQFTNTIERITKEQGLSTINLFSVFDSEGPEGLYFKDGDTHWNDAGQDLAAKVLASFISDSVWDK